MLSEKSDGIFFCKNKKALISLLKYYFATVLLMI